MATAFAKAPNSCELNKLLNRNWSVQIKPVGTDPANYKFVRGLTSVSVSTEKNAVDASDNDSEGWQAQEATSRTFKVSLEGQYAQKGQLPLLTEDQLLLKLTGEELGANGKVDVRVWRTDIDEGWESTVTNMFTSGGGAANDLRTFTAELQSVCAPTRIHSVEEGGEREASKPIDEEEAFAILRPSSGGSEPSDTLGEDDSAGTAESGEEADEGAAA